MWKPRSPPGPPGTPVKVLGLGFPRTGTASFARALETLLDQPVYHPNTEFSFWAQVRHPREAERHARRWNDILSISLARVRDPSNHTVSEAQRQKHLLAQQYEGYAAITDAPGTLYAKELRELYPDAQVIVTTRDEDQWLKSFKSLARLLVSPWLGLQLWPIPGMRHWRQHMELMESGRWKELYYTQGEVKAGKYVYTRHMEYLRRELGDDLHFFNVKDGWGPLCELLGTEVPDTAFPHVNDATAVERAITQAIRAGLLMWAGIVGCIIGMIFLVWKNLELE